jgi:hypothetical protein
MIIEIGNDKDSLKPFSSHSQDAAENEDFVGGGVAEAAVGDKNNDQINTCKICAENGFPREPTVIEKVPGRMLADGTNQTKSYHVLDYVTSQEQEHKDLWRDLAPKLWQQAQAVEGV